MKRIIIGISGASGAPLAVATLKALAAQPEVETHLIISQGARLTIAQETSMTAEEVEALADLVYDNGDLGAAISSGSYPIDGMIVVPCSMKTLAGINAGYCEDLLQRAADVTMKEQRKLVLVPRECPFSPIHLRNMYELSKYGVCILAPVVSYYNHPETAEDMTTHIVGKILDRFGLEAPGFRRWTGMEG